MSTLAFFMVLLLTILGESKSSNIANHLKNSKPPKIGCVIDYTSRTGKEQKIAMKIAVQDNYNLCISSSENCAKLDLLFKNSKGISAIATASARNLIRKHKVEAIVDGALSSQEVADYITYKGKLPFILLSSPVISIPTNPDIFKIANDVDFQSQAIAAIVKYFKFKKVTAVFEQKATNGYAALTSLSVSLRNVNSEIEYKPLTRISVEEELQSLKNKSSRVFVVFQFSLPSVVMLFEKAKKMGMVGKGYVWIISDEIASLLDSIDSSINMQGVIGIKTRFVDTSNAFKIFRNKFRSKYSLLYPGENPNPSIFALRAYDSISAIAKANASEMTISLSSSNFSGLSGEIRFNNNNGILAPSPDFDIIMVGNESYKKVAVWSEPRGLVGEFEIPNALKIAVPESACEQFVKVSRDPETKKINVSGFSISVFESVVSRLPYNLPHAYVPYYNGTYDDMVEQVHKKEYDAAVGDISILAGRFNQVEFTHPYINSGLQMIVTAEPDWTREGWFFMNAFTRGMWLKFFLMHLFVCSVAWLIEIRHGNNQELEGFGVMLWFSITTLLYLLREYLGSNLARLVLAPWLFAILIVWACFTASLSSMFTVSQIRPSIDLKTLLKTNATVGCNGKSFIVEYLATTLKFNRENIKSISSIDDYPDEFRKGHIKAAFLLAPHAEVFLAKNCYGFSKADSVHSLAGLGFALQKGSPLVDDISKAIVQIINESDEVQCLEKDMLSSFPCLAPLKFGSGPIGPEPFFGLFTISAVVCALAVLVALVCLVRDLFTDPSRLIAMLKKNKGFWRWASRRKLINNSV